MNEMIVRGQRGSFLIEVIIGGSLLAGVGLAGATLYKNNLKNQDYLDKIRELDAFHSSLTKLLQNSAHCNATFNPWGTSSAVPGNAANEIKYIKICSGPSTVCNENSTAQSVTPTNSTILITEASARLNDGKQWITSGLSSTSPRQRNWQVKDLGMTPVNRSGKALLEILYELYPGRTNSRTIKKDIELYFKFAPGRFVSCGSARESSVRSVLQELCESMAKSLTAPSGSSLLTSWNQTTQMCDLRNSINCPSNTTFAGFDSNGLVKCVSLTRDVMGAELYDPNTTNCSGNKIPSVVVGADKKLRIVCN